MGETDDDALVELYRKAYGCYRGPKCWCATAERIAQGDEYVRRQAEEAAVEKAGGPL
jgi:hypothetical protein